MSFLSLQHEDPKWKIFDVIRIVSNLITKKYKRKFVEQGKYAQKITGNTVFLFAFFTVTSEAKSDFESVLW